MLCCPLRSDLRLIAAEGRRATTRAELQPPGGSWRSVSPRRLPYLNEKGGGVSCVERCLMCNPCLASRVSSMSCALRMCESVLHGDMNVLTLSHVKNPRIHTGQHRKSRSCACLPFLCLRALSRSVLKGLDRKVRGQGVRHVRQLTICRQATVHPDLEFKTLSR